MRGDDLCPIFQVSKFQLEFMIQLGPKGEVVSEYHTGQEGKKIEIEIKQKLDITTSIYT